MEWGNSSLVSLFSKVFETRRNLAFSHLPPQKAPAFSLAWHKGALTEEGSYQRGADPLVQGQELDDGQRLPGQGIAQPGQRVLLPHQLRVGEDKPFSVRTNPLV